ncbi:N-acetyltransferase [Geitlerinema sp. P-1104]|uniref:GNAT family N-acetyltransferase n=1 Tax=Geitlerinema sp. P-1104 TaxID=2546230 RepID=UPI001476AF1B|nr:GNAT family N-acetyltransferase [Geitlerinema sp. P-1104]NMG58181.1 N-acetyltransferase [Geitlerinema sp. P-1104]
MTLSSAWQHPDDFNPCASTFPLKTRRTLLKPFTHNDLPHLSQLYSKPEVMQFLGGVKSESQTREILQDYISQAETPICPLAIFTHDGQFIGRSGLRRSCSHEVLQLYRPNGEIIPHRLNRLIQVGYVIDVPFQKQGLATEVTKTVLQWGLQQLQLPEIVALIHPDNYGSVRIARDKSGMNLEGCFLWNGLPWQFFRRG